MFAFLKNKYVCMLKKVFDVIHFKILSHNIILLIKSDYNSYLPQVANILIRKSISISFCGV